MATSISSPHTIIGNLTDAPELRFTQSGIPVANFTIAGTPRVYDKQTGQWADGETSFFRCTAWRTLAENIAASVQKGHRVVANGEFKQRNFEDREGNKRSTVELEVEDIGPSLKYGTTQFTRTQAPQNNPAQATGGAADAWSVQPQQGQNFPRQGQAAPAQNDEPWSTPGPATPQPQQAQAPQGEGGMFPAPQQGQPAGVAAFSDDTPF